MPFLYWFDFALLCLSAIIGSALAFIALGTGLQRSINRTFAYFAFCLWGWMASAVVVRIELLIEAKIPAEYSLLNPDIFVQTAYLALGLAGPFLFIFTIRFLGIRTPKQDILGGLGFLAATILSFPLFQGRFMENPRLLSNGVTVVDISPIGILAGLLPVGYILLSLIFYIREGDRESKWIFTIGMLSIAVGYLFGGLFEMHFPVMTVGFSLGLGLISYIVIGKQVINPLREFNLKLRDEIEQHKTTQEALREREIRYRTLFESARDAIMIISGENFVDCNEQALGLFDCQREDIVGSNPYSSFSPHKQPDGRSSEEKAQEMIKLAYAGETQLFEWQHRRLNGDLFHTEVHLSRFETQGKYFLQAIVRDISAKKKAEQKIKEQLKHLGALHHIDTAITTNVNLQDTLAVVLKQVVEGLHVDAAQIHVFDEVQKVLSCEAFLGFKNVQYNPNLVMHNKSFSGEVAASNQGLWLSLTEFTYGRQKMIPEEWRQEGFHQYSGIPLLVKGNLKGVLELFHRSPFSADDDWLQFQKMLAKQAAIAIDNGLLFDGLHRSRVELERAYEETLMGWARMLEVRDFETKGHSDRVANLSVRLAAELGFSAEAQIHIRRGALLHDIGKLGIPDQILLKPGPLTEAEMAAMRQHTRYAYRVLRTVKFLEPALDIVLYHHERWDGSGYPACLAGEEIPLSARLFAVIDVWDSLTSDRPYRKAWSHAETRSYMNKGAGSHFDPQVLKAFWELLDREVLPPDIEQSSVFSSRSPVGALISAEVLRHDPAKPK